MKLIMYHQEEYKVQCVLKITTVMCRVVVVMVVHVSNELGHLMQSTIIKSPYLCYHARLICFRRILSPSAVTED